MPAKVVPEEDLSLQMHEAERHPSDSGVAMASPCCSAGVIGRPSHSSSASSKRPPGVKLSPTTSGVQGLDIKDAECVAERTRTERGGARRCDLPDVTLGSFAILSEPGRTPVPIDSLSAA